MNTPLLTTQGISTGPLVPVVIYHDERSFIEKGMLESGSAPQLRRVYECQADADADVMDVLETCFRGVQHRRGVAGRSGVPRARPAVALHR